MTHNLAYQGQRKQQGFTLIELMLVALLMGLAATTVLLTMDSNGPEKKLKRSAYKMAALTELALDQAVLSGRDFGMVISDSEYHFVELVETRWQAVDDPIFGKQSLKNMVLQLDVEGFKWLPDKKDFSSNELFTEREVDDVLDEQEKPHVPQLLILSSGELTPFKVLFKISGDNFRFLSESQQQYRVLLSADSLGLIGVKEPDDE